MIQIYLEFVFKVTDHVLFVSLCYLNVFIGYNYVVIL